MKRWKWTLFAVATDWTGHLTKQVFGSNSRATNNDNVNEVESAKKATFVLGPWPSKTQNITLRTRQRKKPRSCFRQGLHPFLLSSPTGHYSRYGGSTTALLSAYSSTLHLVSNGPHIITRWGRTHMMGWPFSILCHLSISRQRATLMSFCTVLWEFTEAWVARKQICGACWDIPFSTTGKIIFSDKNKIMQYAGSSKSQQNNSFITTHMCFGNGRLRNKHPKETSRKPAIQNRLSPESFVDIVSSDSS